MKRLVVAILMATAVWNPAVAQSLSANWAELTADDFQRALSAASYTCALPFGVVEKHGPSGPLGTDLINVRQTTALAAKLEYVLIFPEVLTRPDCGGSTSAWNDCIQHRAPAAAATRNGGRDGAQRLPEGGDRQRSRR